MTKQKKQTAAVPAPARPESIALKSAAIKAQEKKRAQENQIEDRRRHIETVRRKEHLSVADVELLEARRDGTEVNTGFGAVAATPQAAENFERIFGRSKLKGQPGGLTKITKNGRPLTEHEVELLGYANTDQGQADPEIQAELEALRAGEGKTTHRVEVVRDEFAGQILERAEILNSAQEKIAAAGKYGSDEMAAQIEEEIKARLQMHNPRVAAEKQYLAKGESAFWASAQEYMEGEGKINGYTIKRKPNGQVVRVQDAILTTAPKHVVDKINQQLYAQRKRKLDMHMETKGPNRGLRQELAERAGDDARMVDPASRDARKERRVPVDDMGLRNVSEAADRRSVTHGDLSD